ncbi:Kinesin-like protein KIN-4A, partial [Cucurbita argyrosperma subsp. argyrosperma]
KKTKSLRRLSASPRTRGEEEEEEEEEEGHFGKEKNRSFTHPTVCAALLVALSLSHPAPPPPLSDNASRVPSKIHLSLLDSDVQIHLSLLPGISFPNIVFLLISLWLLLMEAGEDCCVKVAVHIRPLIGDERLQGCKDCVTVISGKPQVQIGSHSFTFDHVYGSTGSPSSSMFEECVSSLVDGLFQGYNATVLAYGQTGSGKTYTMGTGFRDGCQTGIIPQVMNVLFSKIETLKDQMEFQLHVSFIEELFVLPNILSPCAKHLL